MANPTTYFGWVMPNSADLVTDLPADFNVFGQGVDTSMQYLLGGTTGQVLSKTSGTNMAFTWVNNDQGDLTAITAGNGISVTSGTGPVPTVAIDTAITVDKTTAQTLTNKTLTSPALTTPTISTLTTNGDLVYGTGSGALSRLGIGSTSQVLTVTAGVPSWATPAAAASGMTLITRSSFSNVASVTYDSVFSATYTAYMIVIENYYAATTTDDMLMELRYGSTTETGTYRYVSIQTASASATVTGLNSGSSGANFMLADQSGNSTEPTRGHLIIPFAGHAGTFGMSGQFANVEASRYFNFNGSQYTSRTYTGFVLKSSASNITGTVAIYGLAE